MCRQAFVCVNEYLKILQKFSSEVLEVKEKEAAEAAKEAAKAAAKAGTNTAAGAQAGSGSGSGVSTADTASVNSWGSLAVTSLISGLGR